MVGSPMARIGLLLLAAVLAFVGWTTAGAYDAGSSDERQGAAALVAAVLTAACVDVSAIREPARKFLYVGMVFALVGIAAYFVLE